MGQKTFFCWQVMPMLIVIEQEYFCFVFAIRISVQELFELCDLLTPTFSPLNLSSILSIVKNNVNNLNPWYNFIFNFIYVFIQNVQTGTEYRIIIRFTKIIFNYFMLISQFITKYILNCTIFRVNLIETQKVFHCIVYMTKF